jgi:hypothetical protein
MKLPAIFSLIGTVEVGRPVQEPRIYIEVIPREVGDVVGKSFIETTGRSGTEDDSTGYETLYDAIVDAEHIAARLLSDVVPENLLFVFSESLQAILHFKMKLPPPPCPGDAFEKAARIVDHDQSHRSQQNDSQNRAIVLCKLRHPQLIEQIGVGEQKESTKNPGCHEITWSEFQTLKERLSKFSDHGLSSGKELGDIFPRKRP